MTAQTKSTLMREMRERREREGLVRLDVWVKREDVERVRKYVARINRGEK